jgi:hypothetical protein
MSDQPQDPAQTDWESEGGAVAPEPKQMTPKGLEIPVPKRRDLMDSFRKIVGARTLHCHVCGEPIIKGERFSKATVMVDGKRAPAVIHETCMPKR